MLSSGASGTLAIGPTILSCISIILSIFANSRCNLVKLESNELLSNFEYAPDSLGLWCYQANNGNNYDARDFEGDSKYEAARGLGTTTMVFGWIIFFFYLFAVCLRVGPVVFRIVGLFGILTCLFQGLVFLVYKSDVCDALGCSLDTGGRCGIAAVVFWWLTGMSSLAAGKGVEEEATEAREGVAAGEEEQNKQAEGKGLGVAPEPLEDVAAGDEDAAAGDVEENK
jgi:hypothetical protein